MFVGDTLLSLYCLAASTFDKGHWGIIVVNALDRLLANSPPDDAKVCQALHRLGSGQLCMPSTPTFPRPLRNAIFAVTSEYCCLMIVPLRAKTILKVLVSASERPALASKEHPKRIRSETTNVSFPTALSVSVLFSDHYLCSRCASIQFPMFSHGDYHSFSALQTMSHQAAKMRLEETRMLPMPAG